MLNLSTTYMGLELKNPIIVSSSKLTSTIDNVRECADRGAGAVVLKSLFEEQLLADVDTLYDQDEKYFWYPEAVEFLNEHSREHGLQEYLALIEAAKQGTEIPIIGSIHCRTPVQWPKFAAKLEEAGVDGLELNIAILPFDESVSSVEIENTYLEIVREVKKYVTVPVAVKIGGMFTNPFQMVSSLAEAGADAVVLFNRFYRPDIDLKKERVVRGNILSAPEEMTRPLRWVSLLANRAACDVAGNTGIHDAESVIKHLLVGAAAVQVCSTLYKNGIGYLETMVGDLEAWLKDHNYSSVSAFQGKLARQENQLAAFERIQYMRKTLTEL